jgi:hypothetical protein
MVFSFSSERAPFSQCMLINHWVPTKNEGTQCHGKGAFSAPQHACNGRQGKKKDTTIKMVFSFSNKRAPFSHRMLNHRVPRKDEGGQCRSKGAFSAPPHVCNWCQEKEKDTTIKMFFFLRRG